MATGPKPIEVGAITCPFHANKQQAAVKKSLKKNKLFISCPECGLIMPTLAPFQEYLQKNTDFINDFKAVYGDGRDFKGGGEPEAYPEPEKVPESNPEPEKKKARSFEEEMGL